MHSVLYTRFILDLYARLLSGWSMHDDFLNISDSQIAGIIDFYAFQFDYLGVPVRLYQPKGERASDGIVVFIHGGGFVIGEIGQLPKDCVL